MASGILQLIKFSSPNALAVNRVVEYPQDVVELASEARDFICARSTLIRVKRCGVQAGATSRGQYYYHSCKQPR